MTIEELMRGGRVTIFMQRDVLKAMLRGEKVVELNNNPQLHGIEAFLDASGDGIFRIQIQKQHGLEELMDEDH